MIISGAPPRSRRNFLAAAGGVGLGLSAGLTACSTAPTDGPDTGVAGRGVELPIHREPEGLPTADLPGVPGRLAPGYLSYPSNPPSMAQSGPGSGGVISAAYPISGPVPPPVDRNVYWQAINKELNADFQATLVPSNEWAAKFSVMVAGDDLPDLISANEAYPRLPSLLEAKFTDLTEFVSGSAILDYPNIANLPTDSWKGGTFNGKIFAIPQAKEPMPSVMFARKDLMADLDVPAEWSTFAGFREVCRQLTSAASNRWAIGTLDGVIQHVMSMLGVPNAWASSEGAFTAQVETEQYKQGLAAAAQLWNDGVFHPDALSSTTADGKQWLVSGACLLHWDSIGAWSDDVFKQARLGESLTCVVPPGFDGGPGTSAISKPWFRLMLMPKAATDRVQELLRVLNYLYAPFGSKEYVLKTYGVEGPDFTYDGTEPIPTSQGITETALMMRYVGTPPVATYTPGQPEVTKARHAYGKAVQDIIVDDPTVGLQSETAQSKTTELATLIKDVSFAVVSGRADLAQFDSTLADWRKQGGDAIRREYQEAQQQSGG